MSTADQLKWNKKYEQRLYEANERLLPQPNERLTLFNNYFRGNKALDIASGLGGNSFHLAKLGYEVTAMDVSDVAIQYVNEVANKHSLAIEGHVVDLEVDILPQRKFDLVINTLYLQRNLFKSMQESLNPGGYLFIETYFLVEENDPNPRMKEEYKLVSQELLKIFNELTIIFYHEDRETGLATLFAQNQLVGA